MVGPSRLLPKKLPLSPAKLDALAQAIRDEVFARDRHRCRIPWCRRMVALEWAHLHARGMGGNPDGSRHTTANSIVACHKCHRGVRSLHSGHIQWRFLSDRGADGKMVFEFHEEVGRLRLGLLEGFLVLMRIRFRSLGAHIHCRVFTSSRPGAVFTKSGNLIVAESDWPEIRQQLEKTFEVLPEVDDATVVASREALGDRAIDGARRG